MKPQLIQLTMPRKKTAQKGKTLLLKEIPIAIRKINKEGGENNYLILHIERSKNYYLQFGGQKDTNYIYAEVVSNAYLSEGNKLSDHQMDIIKNLGYKQEFEGENFIQYFTIDTQDQFDDLIKNITRILKQVFSVLSEKQIEIDINLE